MRRRWNPRRCQRRIKIGDRLLAITIASILTMITLVCFVYAVGPDNDAQGNVTYDNISDVNDAISQDVDNTNTSSNIIDDEDDEDEDDEDDDEDEDDANNINMNHTDEEDPIQLKASDISDAQDNFEYREDLNLPYELQKHTWEISEEYNIRYTLLLSMMYRESRFVSDAINYNANGTTDSGLMQLNDTTRKFLNKYGIYDYMDPYQNIEGGAILIRHHLDNNNQNERCALMAYQYGQIGAEAKFRQNIWTSSATELLYQIERAIISFSPLPIQYNLMVFLLDTYHHCDVYVYYIDESI